MKVDMKKNDWLFGAVVALIGLLFIIIPGFWINAFVILLGLAAVAYGIYVITVTRKVFDNSKYSISTLVKGIASILVGLIAVISPISVGKTVFGTIIYMLAIFLIIAAAIGFYSVSLLKETGIERKRYILENLALLAVAVVLFFIGPEGLGKVIVRILGIILMIVGIVFAILGIKSAKEVVIVETEVKDEKESE